MRIALLMMQKNESSLLGPWIRYHTGITDSASIHIFDNGSSHPDVLERLAEAEQEGIQVIRSHNQASDYLNTGRIFSEFINHLDATNPHDFYFPIDCDEFLACHTAAGLSCQPSELKEQLKPFLANPKVLHIPFKYYNNPYQPNRYTRIDHSPKCFFAQDSCESLSHGFHQGTSRAGSDQLSTPITYFEFHYKSYQQHQFHAAQKIEHLIFDLSRRSLIDYSRTRIKTNYHCAIELLQSEYEYSRSFNSNKDLLTNSCLLDRFDELHIDATPLFSASPLQSKRGAISLLADHWRMKLRDSAESSYYQCRALASRFKAMISN